MELWLLRTIAKARVAFFWTERMSEDITFELLLTLAALVIFFLGFCLGGCVSRFSVKPVTVVNAIGCKTEFVIFPQAGNKYHRKECNLVKGSLKRRPETRTLGPCLQCKPWEAHLD